MSCSCLGTELGSLLFSCSVQFIQFIYLEKGKKKEGRDLFFSWCFASVHVPWGCSQMSGMGREATLVNLICGCIYKCTSCFRLHIGCHWERREINTHRDLEEAVWCISVQGCCSSWSGRRAASRPCTLGCLDAGPSQCLSWVAAVSRSELILLMFSAQSGEESSSLQEAFSPSYP